MKKLKAIFASALALVILSSSAIIPASASVFDKNRLEGLDYVEGEAVVVLKDNASSIYTNKNKSAAAYGSGVTDWKRWYVLAYVQVISLILTPTLSTVSFLFTISSVPP